MSKSYPQSKNIAKNPFLCISLTSDKFNFLSPKGGGKTELQQSMLSRGRFFSPFHRLPSHILFYSTLFTVSTPGWVPVYPVYLPICLSRLVVMRLFGEYWARGRCLHVVSMQRLSSRVTTTLKKTFSLQFHSKVELQHLSHKETFKCKITLFFYAEISRNLEAQVWSIKRALTIQTKTVKPHWDLP